LDLRRGRTPCLRIEAERERRRTRVEAQVDQTRSSAVPTPAVVSLPRGPHAGEPHELQRLNVRGTSSRADDGWTEERREKPPSTGVVGVGIAK
jgi:hypothetical protein